MTNTNAIIINVSLGLLNLYIYSFSDSTINLIAGVFCVTVGLTLMKWGKK